MRMLVRRETVVSELWEIDVAFDAKNPHETALALIGKEEPKASRETVTFSVTDKPTGVAPSSEAEAGG